MHPTLPEHVTLSPEVLFQLLDDEAVLLNLAEERYYTLDDVGTRMWRLLEEHGGVEVVVERLLEEYDVEEATLRRDLADLLDRLANAGLVTLR